MDSEAQARWLRGLPPAVQAVAKQYPPQSWYRLDTDEDPDLFLYTIESYDEIELESKVDHQPVENFVEVVLTLTRHSVATGEVMWGVIGVPPADVTAVLGDPDSHRAALTPERLALGRKKTHIMMQRLRATLGERSN